MANSDTLTPGDKLVGVLDSTGATTAITVPGNRMVDVICDVASGDTLQLQVEALTGDGSDNTAAWLTIESYTSDTIKTMRFAESRRVRINKSVDAGTSTFEINISDHGWNVGR